MWPVGLWIHYTGLIQPAFAKVSEGMSAITKKGPAKVREPN